MFHTDEKDTEKGAGGLAFRDRSINLDGNLWEVLKTVVSIMLRLYKAFGSEEPSARDDFVPEFFGRSIDLDRSYTGYPIAYRAAPAIAASAPVARLSPAFTSSISPGKYIPPQHRIWNNGPNSPYGFHGPFTHLFHFLR